MSEGLEPVKPSGGSLLLRFMEQDLNAIRALRSCFAWRSFDIRFMCLSVDLSRQRSASIFSWMFLIFESCRCSKPSSSRRCASFWHSPEITTGKPNPSTAAADEALDCAADRTFAEPAAWRDHNPKRPPSCFLSKAPIIRCAHTRACLANLPAVHQEASVA